MTTTSLDSWSQFLEEGFASQADAGGLTNSAPRTVAHAAALLQRLGAVFQSDVEVAQARVEQARPIWQCCTLFVARVTARHATGENTSSSSSLNLERPERIPLSKILKAFEVAPMELLKELRHFVEVAKPLLKEICPRLQDIEGQFHLRELESTFIFSAVLANKYRTCFKRYFKVMQQTQLGGHGAGNARMASYASVFQFGWLLFIYAKQNLLEQFPDLVKSFAPLVCTLNFLIAHAAQPFLKVSLDDTTEFCVRTRDGDVDTLASLCEQMLVCYEDIAPLMTEVYNLLLPLLMNVPELHCSPHVTLVGSPKFSTGIFEGLFSSSCLKSSQDAIAAAYEAGYLAHGELDERTFVGPTDHGSFKPPKPRIPGSPSVAARSPSVIASPLNRPLTVSKLAPSPYSAVQSHRVVQSPASTRSPFHRHTALGSPSPFIPLSPAYVPTMVTIEGTPISTSLRATMWLRGMAARNAVQPSENLRRIFKAQTYDIGESLHEGISRLASKVFGKGAEDGTTNPEEGAEVAARTQGSAEVVQKKNQAIRLYYSVLESLLLSEEKRCGHTNFAGLLQNDVSHRALFACACEIVQASYKDARLSFPTIPRLLQVCPFDVSKVIEIFVFHQEGLPKELKRHLSETEWRILEFTAWEPKSSIYPLMAKMRVPTGTISDPIPAPSSSAAATTASDTSPTASPTEDPSASRSAAVDQTSDQETDHMDVDACAEGDGGGGGGADPPHLRTSTPEASADPYTRDTRGPTPETTAAFTNAAAMLSPRSHRSAFTAFPSPARPSAGQRMARPDKFGPPDQIPPPEVDPVVHRVLKAFFEKVAKLGHLRARDLCDRLELAPPFHDQVHKVITHTIYEHTHLLYNRHLDQLILCTVYGVCKVNNIQTPFKNIIHQYKQMKAPCRQEVFRTVILEQTEDLEVTKHGDIIAFYNQLFMPNLKRFMLTMQTLGTTGTDSDAANGGSVPSSPVRGTGGSQVVAQSPGGTPHPLAMSSPRPPIPPLKHDHVYVHSALNSADKQEMLASPDPKGSYYAMVGQSSQPFQSPSRELHLINEMLAAPRETAYLASPSGRPPPPASSFSPSHSQEPGPKRVKSS